MPPHALHFGRLWESVVKSAKRHLLRTIGETYEELYTVLDRVEVCLNSRPLHLLFSILCLHPKDLNPLIPRYYLTGSLTTDLIHLDVTDVKVSCLSRFQLLQAKQRHFWRRWEHDYLHQFQQRSK